MDELNAPYFKYWGKADRDDPSRYHLLPYHCLDVAAVGWILLDSDKLFSIKEKFRLAISIFLVCDFLFFCDNRYVIL